MTYDITDKKRLKRVAKLLLRYGRRVQKSVFACDINERRRRELASKLGAEKQDGDSIVIYEYKEESSEEIMRAAKTGGGKNPGACRNRHGNRSRAAGGSSPSARKKREKTEKHRKKGSGGA